MSLIAYETYVRLSGDTTTPSATALEAVDDAVSLLDDVLNRTLTLGLYSEVVKVTPSGFAYPRAIPLVSTPASASPQAYDTVALHYVSPDDTLDGWIDVDWYPEGFALAAQAGSGYSPHYPRARVLYEGGYTEATLPFTIKRAIALIAGALATGTGWTPPATGSRSVGDVSVSVTESDAQAQVDSLVPGLWATIKRRRRRSP